MSERERERSVLKEQDKLVIMEGVKSGGGFLNFCKTDILTL